jgi:hypothetical protein
MREYDRGWGSAPVASATKTSADLGGELPQMRAEIHDNRLSANTSGQKVVIKERQDPRSVQHSQFLTRLKTLVWYHCQRRDCPQI